MSTDLRVRDLGVAAAFLVAGLFLVFVVPYARIGWWGPDAGGPRWPDLIALVVACLGATQRRTRPVLGLAVGTCAVAAGVLVIGFTGLGVLIVFGDLLYCVVLHGTRRAGWAVAGAAGAVLAVLGLLNLVVVGPGAAVVVVLNMSLLLGVPVVWAYEVRQQRERADVERDRAEHASRMAELDRTAAVTAERARMARDLHDVIAGQLSAIAIQSEAALTIPDPDPAALRRVLTAVRRDSVASLTEMRTMIGLLRDDDTAGDEPLTAPAGLGNLATLLDVGRATGIHIGLDDRRAPDAAIPVAVDLAAYRIVQESLTNAAKHAPGSTVQLALRHDGPTLVIELENDLVRTAPPAGGTGTGLLGLRERAGAVGGKLAAGPDGRRWKVRAELPALRVGPASDPPVAP